MVAPGFPRSLLGGYAHFRKNRLSRERERYEQLAEIGQKPETMIIACCDSRSAPETIFGAAPGEMFVVRNVANIVPPYNVDANFGGTSAALEFAVQALRVKHIVVMGHGRCGGIAAFRQQLTGDAADPLSPGDFIGKWISLLEPAGQRIQRITGESAEELQGKLEAESIRQSIEHLKSFPCVSTLLERNQIGLHGAWFDISTGELWTLNSETDEFEQPFD
ncbi:MAG: carbonic anhydrase [Rhizobiaceae bacterium]